MAILLINQEKISTQLPEDTPLLWFLRDHLGIGGTKFACGMAVIAPAVANTVFALTGMRLRPLPLRPA